AGTDALQGTSLQTVYPLKSTLSGDAATEETPLSELNIFKGADAPIDPADRDKTMYVYGTKPNGEVYAGSFEIQPWAAPSETDPTGSLGDLVQKINNTLAQGNDRFGTARVENGNIIVNSVGAGEGFSFFIGEDGAQVGPPAVPAAPPIWSSNATVGAGNHLAADPDVALDQATPSVSTTVNAAGNGLLNPNFTVGGALPTSAPFSVSVRVNGREVGTVPVPLGYNGTPANLNLPSYPKIDEGDTLEYAVIGIPAGVTVTPETSIVLDSDTNNITQDSDGNGIADMFQEDSIVDANAWQYRNETNSTFNWYRARFVPDLVSSSIEVYDSQGGRHTVEMRYFRIGTRTESDSAARINSWDMIIDIPQGTGVLTDDLVTGIEFDQFGRFTGSIGTTIHNTSLNSTSYVGSPASSNIQIDWETTGPTDPATIRLDFGESGSVEGLTGFGSASTASAVDQDGFTDGKLDSISVSSEGDVVALYTNGISRKIAQIPLVTFSNPSGLSQQENNLWQITTNSGSPTRRTAGQNSGFVTSGALENSNVDIATEFTRLITSQRGFQVSARVVQTTDEILEELANLVR
ncbi:MAG: flagellar hook-basal body complex protein, partial [Planctomycetota bacterium]